MTILQTSTPTGSPSPTNWSAGFVFVDRHANMVIPNNSNVTALGLYSTAAITGFLKIQRENTSTSYTCLLSYPFSHPGGGMVFFPVPAGLFVIPLTGAHRASVYLAGWIDRSNNDAPRATKDVNSPGPLPNETVTGYSVSSGLPVLAVEIDGTGEPPPPPPTGDPVDCFLVGPAQSNALNFGPGTAFKARYMELAPPPRGVEFFNRAVGSSFLRPNSSSPHWDPNVAGNLIIPAADAFKAFVEADPLRVAKGGIMYIGESCGAAGREVNTLHHMTDALARIQYIRTRTGFLNMPYVIVELHEAPGGYPNWPDVQFSQRMNCSDADGYGRVPDAYLVSAADLGGGVLHLNGADLDTLLRRIAEKFVSVLFP